MLEVKNPATGEQPKPEDLDVVSYGEAGVGMLEDAIRANQNRLSDPAYRGQAIAFVKASLQGWAFRRDNAEKCRDIVVAKQLEADKVDVKGSSFAPITVELTEGGA